MKVCALMKECVHSVETAPKTNFMSCFNIRFMMRFVNRACTYEEPFNTYDQTAKFLFLFSSPHMIRICAKPCFSILQRRLLFLSK